ncbi:hypothetical protein LIER_28992 [Lithospermum erythrorhizon]|uniref:Uncharacterized protein n=1 Tax=Lithospermum erythrorhizon TaxID=34254 RepID=A0AAV3RJ54_LITER
MQAANDAYWAQRAQTEWNLKGDRNTINFHALSAQRGKQNLITALQDDNQVWQNDIQVIHTLTVTFFIQGCLPRKLEGLYPSWDIYTWHR